MKIEIKRNRNAEIQKQNGIKLNILRWKGTYNNVVQLPNHFMTKSHSWHCPNTEKFWIATPACSPAHFKGFWSWSFILTVKFSGRTRTALLKNQ